MGLLVLKMSRQQATASTRTGVPAAALVLAAHPVSPGRFPLPQPTSRLSAGSAMIWTRLVTALAQGLTRDCWMLLALSTRMRPQGVSG